MRRFLGRRAPLGVALVSLLLPGRPALAGQRYEDFITPTPLREGETLALGFLGGLERWDNATQGVRKVALRLRARNLPGVYVETLESNKRRLALRLIRNAFDRDRDGTLDEGERHSAHIVLYGMSFGGASLVRLARRLKKLDIPVLLTVQVDSVGRGDDVVPSNVKEAANLYQRNGRLVRGEPVIRPEDPSRTHIIGNFLYDYRGMKIDLSAVPWYKKVLRVAHAKMNEDERVWARVEELILSAVRPRLPNH